MFIPTPGYIYSAVDYAQLELCALAESCFRRFGSSKLMDTINSGVDCHKYMATFFTGKEITHITKDERQLAKVANFGYPGGLQPDSFRSYALGYGIKVSLEMAERREMPGCLLSQKWKTIWKVLLILPTLVCIELQLGQDLNEVTVYLQRPQTQNSKVPVVTVRL